MKLFITLFSLILLPSCSLYARGIEADLKYLLKNSSFLEGNVYEFSGKSSSLKPITSRLNRVKAKYSQEELAANLALEVSINAHNFDLAMYRKTVLLAQGLGVLNDVAPSLAETFLLRILTVNTSLDSTQVMSLISKTPLGPEIISGLTDVIKSSGSLTANSIAPTLEAYYNPLLEKHLASTQSESSPKWKLSQKSLIEIITALSLATLKNSTDSKYQLLTAKLLANATAEKPLAQLVENLKGLSSLYLLKSTYPLLTSSESNRHVNGRLPLSPKIQDIIKKTEEIQWEVTIEGRLQRINQQALLNEELDNEHLSFLQLDEDRQIQTLKRLLINRSTKEIVDWVLSEGVLMRGTVQALHNAMRFKNSLVEQFVSESIYVANQGIFERIFDYKIADLFSLSPEATRRLVDKHLEKNEFSHAYYILEASAFNLNTKGRNRQIMRAQYFMAFKDLFEKWVQLDLQSSSKDQSIQKLMAVKTMSLINTSTPKAIESLKNTFDSDDKFARDSMPNESAGKYLLSTSALISRSKKIQNSVSNKDELLLISTPQRQCLTVFRPFRLSIAK